jgi:hypothetical protein
MCEICGRSSCTRSFHSLSEQEEFDTKTGRYAPEEKRCEYCDGTGDVHRADGEYMGKCDCEA